MAIDQRISGEIYWVSVYHFFPNLAFVAKFDLGFSDPGNLQTQMDFLFQVTLCSQNPHLALCVFLLGLNRR